MFLSFLMLFFSSSPSYAISELNYSDTYQKDVLPYFDPTQMDYFAGVGGVKIAYRVFKAPNEKAKIVLLPGRTEPIRKYAELIYDLQKNYGLLDKGVSIYVMEHRGQGESGRIAPDPQMQYVDSYRDFLKDLESFMDKIVLHGPDEDSSKAPTKTFLLAHSMGAAIGTLYLWQHPGVFDAAALSGPMFEVNTSPYPESIAHGLAYVACAFGQGKHFAPGQTDYVPFQTYTLGMFTSSGARYHMTEQTMVDYPETKMGGASYGFLSASFHATNKIAKISHLIETPLLMFQAGSDQVIRPEGQHYFCSHAKNCEKVVVPGSQHEMLMESDSIRTGVVEKIIAFFDLHL